MDKNTIKWGIIVLTVGVLTPFVTGKVGFREVKDVSKRWTAIVAVLAGASYSNYRRSQVKLNCRRTFDCDRYCTGRLLGVTFLMVLLLDQSTAAGLLAVMLGIINVKGEL